MGLRTLFQNVQALPMIRLKDYLLEKFSISIKGKKYICSNAQAYEDNPYFYSYRFTTAQNFSESYLRTMNSDSADKTNRTTYYTNSAVLLI